MLKAKVKYNIGSKPKDLPPAKCTERDERLKEDYLAKIKGQNQRSKKQLAN